jgi:hypothetical protein
MENKIAKNFRKRERAASESLNFVRMSIRKYMIHSESAADLGSVLLIIISGGLALSKKLCRSSSSRCQISDPLSLLSAITKK